MKTLMIWWCTDPIARFPILISPDWDENINQGSIGKEYLFSQF